MKKIKILALMLLVLTTSFWGFAENKKNTPIPPDSILFQYRLGEKANFVIQLIKRNNMIRVWLHDTRFSDFPVIVYVQRNNVALKQLQLPETPWISEPNAAEMKLVQLPEEDDNAIRNLRNEGLLVLSQERMVSPNRLSHETILVPLRDILLNHRPSGVSFFHVPPVSKEFPHRSFQMIETQERNYLVNVIEANDEGVSRSRTFLQTPAPDSFVYEIETPWVDLNKIQGQVRFSADKKSLVAKGHTLFDLEDPQEASLAEFPMRDEAQLHDVRGQRVRSSDSVPGWDGLKTDYKPNRILGFAKEASFEVIEFLNKLRRIKNPLTMDAYKVITNSKTSDKAAANAIPHLKLQVSELGMLSYRESSDKAPLFLQMIDKSNMPVAVSQQNHILRVTFEKGNTTIYDLRNGKRLGDLTPASSKQCLYLFM